MIGIISRTEGKGSGAEMVLCHLLNNWDGSFPLLVITAVGSSVAEVAKNNGIEVLELPFIAEKILPNVKLIERQLRYLRKIHLIHAWNSKSFELGWYMSKRLGIKLTCTLHDHPRANYYTSKKLKLLKWVANASEKIVVVSNKLKAECAINGYKRPAFVIHNGLPNVTVNLRKPPKKLVIGFLGMSSHVKGFEIVADWIDKTKGSSEIEWYLYGNICEQYEVLVQKLSDNSYTNFKIMGQQNPETIFKQIHLLVNTSVSFDCLPTVLIEATRMGIPAIASSNGGSDEIVEHGNTGFIFDPSSPEVGLSYLNMLLSDREKWMNFSNAARRRFEENFKIEKMVSGYSRFWNNTILFNSIKSC